MAREVQIWSPSERAVCVKVRRWYWVDNLAAEYNAFMEFARSKGVTLVRVDKPPEAVNRAFRRYGYAWRSVTLELPRWSEEIGL